VSDGYTVKAVMVKMLFFGPLAENLGEREVVTTLEIGTTCNQLIELFELSNVVADGVAVAIDGQIGADRNSALKDASEIAFLPPVSGG
jgi:molybdopterin converting factor small subunit